MSHHWFLALCVMVRQIKTPFLILMVINKLD